MSALRPLTPRPTVVVDNHSRAVGDSAATVGLTGPFGRDRVVYALPLGGVGSQQYAAVQALQDRNSNMVADPTGVVTGFAGVWISRLLFARWTEDTRRF